MEEKAEIFRLCGKINMDTQTITNIHYANIYSGIMSTLCFDGFPPNVKYDPIQKKMIVTFSYGDEKTTWLGSLKCGYNNWDDIECEIELLKECAQHFVEIGVLKSLS